MYELPAVAKKFAPDDRVIEVREFGNGNINSSFLVTLDSSADKHFLLQRINTQVFRRPELLLHNMRIAIEHVLKRMGERPLPEGRRWEVPRLLLTSDGQDHWSGADGSFWRAISFIEDAQSRDTIADRGHAKEVGCALGLFHALLSDLPSVLLADTLEGFHIMPGYLQHHYEVLAGHPAGKSPELDYCIGFVRERRVWAGVLEDAKARGRLLLRPIHGDPKVNNILIDTSTGKAVSMIDLDTIKPGLVHYDIGDCLRSGCNTAGEETEAWETVCFDPDLCRSILEGYLPMARQFLTENDYAYIYDSVRLLAFELGLRFLTDHLEGDVYFKVSRPGHNLARALVQFKLCQSIESQETTIRNIIRDIR